MSLFKKFSAALLCVALCINMFCTGFALETSFKLTEITVKQDSCIFLGICPGGTDVRLSAVDKTTGENKIITSKSDSNGKFSINTDVLNGNEYSISLDIKKAVITTEINPKNARDILGANLGSGYIITSVGYTDDCMILRGHHSGTSGKNITFTAYAPENELPVAVVQTESDSSGSFEIKFDVPSGEYNFNIKADGLDKASGIFKADKLLTGLVQKFDTSDAESCIEALKNYASELDTLISQCEDMEISTDYERVDAEVIRKFIDEVKTETDNNAFGRLDVYMNVLTDAYNNAKTSLKAYLDGTKSPLEVPEYNLKNLRKDGKSLVTDAVLNGVSEDRPFFSVGFGPFDTAVSETEFFSKIGLRAVQANYGMGNFFTKKDANTGWQIEYGSGGIGDISIRPTTENGNGMLKVMNPEPQKDSIIRYLHFSFVGSMNTTYTFGIKAKGSVSDKAVWFSLNGVDAPEGARNYITSNNGWKTYTKQYTTGATGETLDFVIAVEGQTDELYLDDCFVYRGSVTRNLITDGAFNSFAKMTDAESEAFDYVSAYPRYDLIKEYENMLKKAEDNNVLVDACLCTHYMIPSVTNLDPGFLTPSGEYALDNKITRRALGAYARFVASILKKYNSNVSICLFNEPTLAANKSVDGVQHYDGMWKNYLKDKYKTISNLNSEYGLTGSGAYNDFGDVSMPSDIEQTPLFYEYRLFNEKVLTDINDYMAKEIHKEYPDALVHSKVMDYFKPGNYQYLNLGTDYEKLAEVFDVNGCDAFSNYFREDWVPLSIKMMWYDYMGSIKNSPAFDTESHILDDGTSETDYSDTITSYIGADVWNGAIHGRAMDVIWSYETDDSRFVPWKDASQWGSNRYVRPNMALRPAELIEIGKTALDLNRLSKEIAAIQKQEPEVGIIFSSINMGYNDVTENAREIHNAYEQAIFSGQKVGFVTDSKPRDMNKYKLLVVPNIDHLSSDMLDCLNDYNGKILIVGDVTEPLKYNEMNKAHNSTVVSSVINKSVKSKTVSQMIDEMKLSEIVLSDYDNNKLSDVEWSYAKTNEGYVINVLNHSRTETKNIKIFKNGDATGRVTDLKSGETVDGNSFVLAPLKSMLIKIENISIDKVDASGSVLEYDLTKLKPGYIKCTNNLQSGRLIVALYENDVLSDIKIAESGVNSVTMQFEPTDGKSCRIKAMVWGDTNKIAPLTGGKSIETEVTK